jgi:uncharacterized protein involved in exopolysaccharide biosynthesis
MSERHSSREFAGVAGERQRRPGIGLILLLLILLPIAAGLSALAFSVKQTPDYEAKASVLVTFGREYIFRPLRGDEESWSPWRAEIAVNAEMGILNSTALQDAAIRSVGADYIAGRRDDEADGKPSSLFRQLLTDLRGTSVDWGIVAPPADEATAARAMLARNLTIKGVNDSNVIHVSFRHPDRGVAVDVIEALLAAYFDTRQVLFSTPENRFLQAQLGKRLEAFEEAGRRIIAFQDELGIGDFDVTLEGLNQRDVTLAEVIDRLAGEIAAAKGAQKALQTTARTASRLTDNRQANAALDGLEAQLALVQSQHASVRSQQRTLMSQRAVYDALQQQRNAAEQAYMKILTQINDVQTDADLDAAGMASVKVIQDPVVPAKPVSLPPLTLAGLAAGLGFMAGLAIIVTLSATSPATMPREVVWLDDFETVRAPELPAGAAIKLLPVPKRSSFGLGASDKYRMEHA